MTLLGILGIPIPRILWQRTVLDMFSIPNACIEE